MAGSITSSNVQFALSIPGVYGAPQVLQGFSADDIFDVGDVAPNEAMMGVDGYLAAGKIFMPVIQNIVFMASSPSNTVFDNWNGAEVASGDTIFCQASVLFTSIAREFTLVNGAMTGYKPIPDARRTLQPRRYQITWEKRLLGTVQF